MPTYEYLCESCGHAFEAVQKITADALTDCESCGKSTAKRQISATAFHLKGSGWYKTDYASGSSSSGGASSSKSSSGSKSNGESKSTTDSSPTKSEPKPTAKESSSKSDS